jgi:hypothetical protein
MGEMREIVEIGGRRWVGMADGGAVGGWEVMGDGGGVVGLDFRECLEVENGGGRGKCVRRYREMGGGEWEKLT